MKIYLLARTDSQTASAFRIRYIYENLKLLKKICALYFWGVLAIVIASFSFNLKFDEVVNIPGFLSSLYTTLLISPLFYITAYLLVKNFQSKKGYLRFSQVLVIVFSLYLISRGMLNTFYAMHNPRNSLTMYMIWLMAISIFFVFEYYETLFIAMFFVIAFSVLLPYYQASPGELIKN